MAPRGTEEPTPKRRRDARREGRIARSNEVPAWGALLAFSLLLPWAVTTIRSSLERAMGEIPRVAAANDTEAALAALGTALVTAFSLVVLLCGVIGILALLGTISQVGFILTGKPLKPSFKHLNPVANVRNILGLRGLWETGKQIIRAAVLIFIAYGAVRSLFRALEARSGENATRSVGFVAQEMLAFLRLSALVFFALALADYGVQRVIVKRELRMTRQEIRDEFRQLEGDPTVKQRIRALQRDRARRRMLQEVPTSTVVITNPTHYAVALRYSAAFSAPLVTAVGTDRLAKQIKDRALAASVPVVESPPLARALHRACHPGDTIPIALFEAVAQVLAAINRTRPSLGAPMRLDVAVPENVTRRRSRR